MKFSQLDARNAEAIAGFYIKIAEITAAQSQQLAQDGLRLLVLGNGAGVAILATFLGGIIQNGKPVDDLLVPLIWFLIGVVFAALVYLPLIVVASDTAKHIGEGIEKFFKDEVNLEELQGYGLTKRGVFLVNTFLLLSIICFVVGIILCIFALHGRG